METARLTPGSHELLINLFEAYDALLMQTPDNEWRLYDYDSEQALALRQPAHAEELKNHKLIEELKHITITPENSPNVQHTTYAFTSHAIAYLEQHIPLTAPLVVRSRSLQPRYTFEQAYAFVRLAERIARTSATDFHESFVDMLFSEAEGEIYQHTKSGRWRIIYEGAPSVPIRATAVATLLEAELISRHPDNDHYYEKRGYGNCHALTVQGDTLAYDILRDHFDPRDVHLTISTYFEYLETKYDKLFEAHSPASKLTDFVFNSQEKRLFLILLHTTVNPELKERDEHLDSLIESTADYLSHVSGSDNATRTIRELAAETSKYLSHHTQKQMPSQSSPPTGMAD